MLKSLGLRSRLMLLVLAALLPVFVLFSCSAAQNQQTLLTLAKSSLQSEALLAASHQQRLVEGAAQLLGDIANGPSIKDTRNRLCVQYLKNLQTQDMVYYNLGVVDLNGKLTCHAASQDAHIYMGDRKFFIQALAQRKFSVGEFVISRSTGRPGLAFGMPVYSTEGVLNGVVFASVSTNSFAETLATEKIMEGAQLRVLDRNGIVLASHPATGLAGSAEQDSVVLGAARSGQRGVGQALDSKGVEQVYAYAPVGGSSGGLFVALSMPRDLLTAAPRALLLTDLAALLFMTVFGMACAWAMGKRLVVNPANALLKESNEIARGNFLARVQLGGSSHDEIGQLGQAFNRMAESLQAQRSALDAALGQTHAERTMLDLILNSMNEGVIAIDTQGRFLLFNATARTISPAPEAGMLFEEWQRSNPLRSLEATSSILSDGPMKQTLRGASINNWDLLFSRAGFQDRILRMSTRPLHASDQTLIGALMVFTDVTERKARESFALAQEKVLELIASGAPLRQLLDAVVGLVEKESPQSRCSILLVKGGQLFHGAAPSLPDSYNLEVEGLPVAEGIGACGTAAFRKAPVVVEDVARSPLMQSYRELLLSHALRACWSTPVIAADGDVLATFAIYRDTPGPPRPADLDLMATATRLARLALEAARAKEALVNSEARFRELAEKVDDVFYSADIAEEGCIRYISPGYEKIWGRSCESLYALPGSYADAVLPEDRHLLTLARKLRSAGQVSDVEYRIVAADGQMRWIRDRGYPLHNEVGALERVVGTARDVTDSKLAHLALASTNRALQMLSRSSIAINRIHDEAGLLAEVCRVAVELGGYRMAWVGYAQDDAEKTIRPMAHAGHELGYLATISLNWDDRLPSGQGPAGQAIVTGESQQSNDIQSDKRFFWREAALARGYRSSLIFPLCNEARSFAVLCLYAGEVQQFAPQEVQLLQELADNLAFGILSLRTRLERRRSEEAARQAAAKLHEQASLIDLSHDAIMVRNPDRTLRFWNKGAERLYGWTSEEVMGKTMEALMYRSPQVLIEVMKHTVADGHDWSGELEQIRRDGALVHVEMRTTVLRDAQGHVNGMLAVNTDIHERKRARDEIMQLNASLEEHVEQRTAQLKFANQQLEAFSYSVSHDLRSPLSAVDGFSALLEKSMTQPGAAPLAERSRHYLARIRVGVRQMGELIDAMLLLAKVTRASLRWETVDLSAQAQAVLESFQEREPDRVAHWEVTPGLVAQGDSQLLGQVLDNLLGNAWKFTSGKADTCITVGQETGPDGETVFFVRDNGAGFDMSYAAKLFGAFQRLHAQNEFPGTGVGLATVQRIIERHGGRVWADSAPDQGATFYFTLGSAAAV